MEPSGNDENETELTFYVFVINVVDLRSILVQFPLCERGIQGDFIGILKNLPQPLFTKEGSYSD